MEKTQITIGDLLDYLDGKGLELHRNDKIEDALIDMGLEYDTIIAIPPESSKEPETSKGRFVWHGNDLVEIPENKGHKTITEFLRKDNPHVTTPYNDKRKTFRRLKWTNVSTNHVTMKRVEEIAKKVYGDSFISIGKLKAPEMAAWRGPAITIKIKTEKPE